MFHADDFVLCLCHCPCDCINCRDYARADAEPICVMGLQFTRSVQRLPFESKSRGPAYNVYKKEKISSIWKVRSFRDLLHLASQRLSVSEAHTSKFPDI